MKFQIKKKRGNFQKADKLQLLDYKTLRTRELSYATRMGFMMWLTSQAAHVIERIASDSWWRLSPYPIGLLLLYSLHREMIKLRRYCTLFEVRIGNEPLKLNEINSFNESP